MNYDTKRRKFFIVLKYVGSLEENQNSSKSRRKKTSDCREAGSVEPPLDSDQPQEISQNLSFDAEKEDSFERTKHEEFFRGMVSSTLFAEAFLLGRSKVEPRM